MDATDLKLLELAGIAAGETYSEERNPLDCDSLALRLAVKLGIFRDEERHKLFLRFLADELANDRRPTEATRRAIVRAAVEIAGAMK
jgi:hypothetical protein